MKKEFHTYITQSGTDVFLSADEKARMQRTLSEYMAMKPLRAPVPQTRISRWYTSFTPRLVAAGVIIALFGSSAGVSYAAQNALPGDALYGVKVNVNEPIAGALATTPAAKTGWAMNVAGERVKEAAALAAEHRLSTSTQAQLQQNFDAHVAVAATAIDQEASSSPASGSEDATAFEAQLSEYAQILASVNGSGDASTQNLGQSVTRAHARFASLRAQTDESVAAASSTAIASAALQAREAAQAQIKSSLALAETASSSLDSSAVSQVISQIAAASSTLAQGQTLLDDKSAPAAYHMFQNALAAAEQLGVFLQTSASIHAATGLTVQDEGATSSSPVVRTASAMHRHQAVATLSATSTASSTTEVSAPQTETNTEATTSDATSSASSSTRVQHLLHLAVPIFNNDSQ